MRPDGMLEPGDVIDVFREGHCIVDYVNSSGAFVVPLTPVYRIINKFDTKTGEHRLITFKQSKDGFTISATSAVKLVGRVDPYTSRADRRRGIMGTREGALKAAATRAKNRAEATAAGKETAEVIDRIETTKPPTGTSEAPEVEAAAVEAADEPDLVAVAPEPGVNLEQGDTEMAKNGRANGKAKASKARSRKPAGPKEVRKCACGCGGETTGYFVQGHDARFKGWMLKIERGEAKKSELLPAAVIRAYDWVGTKAGERTTTNYRGEKHSGYEKAAAAAKA